MPIRSEADIDMVCDSVLHGKVVNASINAPTNQPDVT